MLHIFKELDITHALCAQSNIISPNTGKRQEANRKDFRFSGTLYSLSSQSSLVNQNSVLVEDFQDLTESLFVF